MKRHDERGATPLMPDPNTDWPGLTVTGADHIADGERTRMERGQLMSSLRERIARGDYEVNAENVALAVWQATNRALSAVRVAIAV